MRPWACGLLLLAAISGCGEEQPTTQPSAMDLRPGGPANLVYQEVTSPDALRKNDQLETIVDVLQVTGPLGALSENPDVWQIVRTDAFSRDFRQLLGSNGLRVGLMSDANWGELKRVIDKVTGITSQPVTLAGKGRSVLKCGEFAQQDLFYFDRAGNLQGRSYEQGENIWGVFFEPDKASPGRVQLQIAPVVRSLRRQMKLTRSGEEGATIEYEQPETVLDLAIDTSLPLGSVLVISPTAASAHMTTSLGRVFMMSQQPGGLTETVYFVHPRIYRMNAEASAKRQREIEEQQQREAREAQKAAARAAKEHSSPNP